MPAKNRDLVIDVLRCGAVLYIVGFWHIIGYSNVLKSFCKTKTTQFLMYCVLGLFVYLSGFLLSQKYSFEKAGDILRFYRRRFLRIYPMYLIVLTVFLVMGYVNLRGYIRAVLLSNMFIDKNLKTLWFITMILVFYAITPLYLKSYKPAKIIIYTIVAYFGLLILHMSSGIIDLRFPEYLPIFAAGIITARSISTQRAMQSKYIVVISFLCFVLLQQIFLRIENRIISVLVISLASFAGVPVFQAMAKALAPLLNKKLVFILSYSSFSLYLIHRITFGIGTMLYRPQTIMSAIFYLVCVLLPVTIAISYLFQMLYDDILQKIFPSKT
jgi:peptidoglycan/LPS O-acetylase OafA/YrhL